MQLQSNYTYTTSKGEAERSSCGCKKGCSRSPSSSLIPEQDATFWCWQVFFIMLLLSKKEFNV